VYFIFELRLHSHNLLCTDHYTTGLFLSLSLCASDRITRPVQGDVGAAAVDAEVLEAAAAPSLHLKKKGEIEWGPFLKRFG
jgi:hypothetical protein